MTFSSDGNAGLEKKDNNGKMIGFRKAPIDRNLGEVIDLVKLGGIPFEEAIKLISSNPAKNLGLSNKGQIEKSFDADLCVFNDRLELTDVFAKGQLMMENKEHIRKGNFE